MTGAGRDGLKISLPVPIRIAGRKKDQHANEKKA
jgi:hypothetical protein